MIAAACMILCIGVCGAGGVRAGMNYAKQRVEKTSEKEQEALWMDAAKADADTFSRELSKKEQQRMNELAEKYQTEGYSRMEVFCRFRINQRLYLIKSVSWLRPVLFICRRKH